LLVLASIELKRRFTVWKIIIYLLLIESFKRKVVTKNRKKSWG
jgi:hypothetical protein